MHRRNHDSGPFRLPGILLLIGTLMAGSCGGDPLVIGIVPSEAPAVLSEEFLPMKTYLERELNREIDVFVPGDYKQLIDAMGRGEVDIGLFGPFSYIVADELQELDPLVVRKKIGFGVNYNSLIITRSDSGLESVEDLEGRVMAFVNTASTSGYIIPQSLFISRDIDVDSWLGSYYFAGSHDLVVDEVLAGRCDAGAVSNTILSRLVEKGTVDRNLLRVLWQSDPIPGSPFVAGARAGKRTKRKFTEAMLRIHETDPEALRTFDASLERYVVIEDGMYDGVRNIVNIMGREYVERNLF